MIWQPYTKSNGQWIAAKILQGFFGSPMESLPEISVSDVVSTSEKTVISILIATVVLHPRTRSLHGCIRPGSWL